MRISLLSGLLVLEFCLSVHWRRMRKGRCPGSN